MQVNMYVYIYICAHDFFGGMKYDNEFMICVQNVRTLARLSIDIYAICYR